MPKAKKIKRCQVCGGKMKPNEPHTHKNLCPDCGKGTRWCRCGHIKHPRVNGKAWPGMKSIVTICPVEFAEQARIIAAEFLNNGELAADMLDVEVAANNTKSVTHVMCERPAFPDEVQRQQAFMAMKNLPWVSGNAHSLNEGLVSQFAMYVKEDEDTFAVLGLREAE